MRIIFMGTSEFAVPSLQSLINSRRCLLAVICQPDRERDRKGNIIFPPVKVCAIAHSIPVLQFASIKDEAEKIKQLAPDIMITAAYGQILTQEILDIPRYGIINIHASLLPKYRGSAPVQWAIANGEKQTGVTIMQTALGLDTGDIISYKELEILSNETAGELLDRLSVVGAELLMTTLDDIESGNAKWTKQDESKATKCRLIKKTDGLIDWNKSADTIKNLVCGMNPWPLAYSFIAGKRMNIQKVEVCEYANEPQISSLRNGEIIAGSKELLVKTGDCGCLRIVKAQFEGKNIMDGSDILRGLRPKANEGFTNER